MEAELSRVVEQYFPLLWLVVALLGLRVIHLLFFAQYLRGQDDQFWVVVKKIDYGRGTEGFKCLQKQKIITSLISITAIVLSLLYVS